jgi:hypothetical protein
MIIHAWKFCCGIAAATNLLLFEPSRGAIRANVLEQFKFNELHLYLALHVQSVAV